MEKKNPNSKKIREITENEKNKKNKNLTRIFKQTKQKIFTEMNGGIGNINTTIIFKIKSVNQAEYEKEYQKRYSYYLKEEFNSNIITMFFNFISMTKVIPVSFKNNRYFIKEFLKIIIDLLINEIDFTTVTLIFDCLGWINEGGDPWLYIYFVCLCAKKKASSDGSYNTLLKILESNNKGFIDNFKKWSNNSSNEKKYNQINIIKTNQRYRDLKICNNKCQKYQRFINYNELVNLIVSASKHKEYNQQVSQLNNINNINNNVSNKKIFNQPNHQMYTNMSLDITPTPSEINNNYSKIEFGKSLNQPVFDLQPNNSFNFDLSRGSSKNSFADFHFKLDLGKSSSFKFNNK